MQNPAKNHSAILEEQVLLPYLKKVLQSMDYDAAVLPPTEDVPAAVLQTNVEEIRVNGQPATVEMFLTYHETGPASSLHIYLTLPVLLPENKPLDTVYAICMGAQGHIPNGCFCVYPEDRTIALRQTMFLRSQYPMDAIADMAVDYLDGLIAGAAAVLEPLLKVL